jgi:hypothetical protein
MQSIWPVVVWSAMRYCAVLCCVDGFMIVFQHPGTLAVQATTLPKTSCVTHSGVRFVCELVSTQDSLCGYPLLLTVDTLKAMSCVWGYSTALVSTPPMDPCISSAPPAPCNSTAATDTCTLSTDLTLKGDSFWSSDSAACSTIAASSRLSTHKQREL